MEELNKILDRTCICEALIGDHIDICGCKMIINIKNEDNKNEKSN